MTECPANATARCPGFNRGEVVDGYQCARGYSGDTCQKCAAPRTYESVGQPTEAYYDSGGGCVPCPITDTGVLLFIAAAVLLALLAGCFFVSVRLAKINVKSFAPFTIALDYFQMLAIMPLLELAWPPLVQLVFEAHEYFSLDIDVFTSQAQCAISFTWFEKTALYFLVPFAMGAGMLLIMALLFALHGCGFQFGFRGRRGHRATLRLASAVGRMSMKGDNRKASMQSRDSIATNGAEVQFSAQPEWMHLYNMCCHAYLYLLNFSYMLITKRALMFVDCEWRPNEQKYYLASDPRVECWDLRVHDERGERLCYDWSAFWNGEKELGLGGGPGTRFGGDPACWRDMMAISLFGFVVYVVGIPLLLSWKLLSNRHYAVFTKSISLQEAKLRQATNAASESGGPAATSQPRGGGATHVEEPEEVVQAMLDLCQGFATHLRRQEAHEHYLYFHTTRLSTMLIKAQRHLLDERRRELEAAGAHGGRFSVFRALAHHTRHDRLTQQIAEHTNAMVEKMDEVRHMRSRYGFLLARWRPALYYWEMVYLARRFFWAVIINQLSSRPVLCATTALLTRALGL